MWYLRFFALFVLKSYIFLCLMYYGTSRVELFAKQIA